MKRVNLWSSPRNISTALMYSFAQRSDTRVVDEPLYARYLAREGGDRPAHPGEREVLRSQSADAGQVIREVLFGDYDRPVVVFKQMTHHLEGLELDFLKDMDNVLLIRDPRAILASYAKVIPNPGARDVGVHMQVELMRYLEARGKLAAIVDARDLLLDPAGVLRKLCDRLELPFEENMLRWEAGPRPEDGVWAKYWYANVHRSTGFQPYRETPLELPAHLEAVAEACGEGYEELRNSKFCL
jgi:hypothetical protein